MTEETTEERRSGPYDLPPEPKTLKIVHVAEVGPDPDAWMVTFSDLLTLLMTFFVLIFASQDPVEQVLKDAFGQSAGVFGLFRMSFLEKVIVAPRKDLSQDRIQVFLDDIGASEINVEQEQRGLVITLPSGTYFESGLAELKPEALKRIGQIGKYLKFTKHQIRVEGHTDNRETGAPGFASPYDLAVARAHRVMTALVRAKVSESRMSLSSYGPARPKYTNLSRAGRLRNRRVEIIILNRGEFP